MMDKIVVTKAEIFAYFASGNYDVWEKLVGFPVCHQTFKNGMVERVEHCENGFLLTIKFNHNQGLKQFESNDFADLFSIEAFPIPLPDLNNLQSEIYQAKVKLRNRELRQQKIIENDQKSKKNQTPEEKNLIKDIPKPKNKPMSLVEKFQIKLNPKTRPDPRLVSILTKRDNVDVLTYEELKWMTEHQYYDFVIDYYRWVYEVIKDPHYLLNAAKLCRKIGRPEEAIQLIANLEETDPKIQSEILMCRGFSYKDLGDFELAFDIAEQLKNYPSFIFYAFHLLGAIHYSMKMYTKGDEYFQKAVESGAPLSYYTYEIKSILTHGSQYEKRKLQEYLLKKDPDQYKWVRNFANVSKKTIVNIR